MQSRFDIKAYTLIEMIIVMIISAIIVSMAYIVYTRVNVIAMNLKNSFNSHYQVALLDKLIYADFQQADKVIKTAEGFICEFDHETHEYQLSDRIIRIQRSQIDTFSFIQDVNYDFEYTNANNYVIKSFKIKGLYLDEEIVLWYMKEYGADIMVNDYE